MGEGLRVRKILVPMDFSASAQRALELALDLAKKAGPAHLMLVHGYYVPPEIEAFAPDRVPSYLNMLSEQASKDLEQSLVALQDAGVSSEYLAEPGTPDHVIIKVAADMGADLIVMGTHGRTGVPRFALGSIAERVVQTAPCPVITVKDEPGE